MSEKNGAEMIVEKLDETKSQVQSLAEKTTEELKSVGDKITLGLKEVFESQAKEEVKSLKAQLANKDEELKSFRSGHGVSKANVELEEKALRAIASKLHNKEEVNFNSEEFKSIRFSDATTTGGFDVAPIKMGEVDVNKQAVVTILGDIDVMPAVTANDGSVVWDGYDESLVDIYDSNEMDAAELSEAVKLSLIKLSMKEVKAKMAISSKVILNTMSGGNQVAVLDRNLRALDSRYNRKLAANVFQDIITAANSSLVGKVASTTAEAPATAEARQDLRLFPSNLKVQYIPNAVMYVSRAFLNALYSKEASDGHLTTEQFVFGNNGITLYVTAERAIPVRVFEHAQIGTYKSLADGSTDITADYVNGSETNTGKLLAIVGDLKSAYKLVPNTVGMIGVDTEIANVMNNTCIAGKVSYAAQGLILREAVKVFYAS